MNDDNLKSSIVPSEAAVEREVNRRRQVLRLFTALLFIPLLAVVGFALFGRTDAEMVRKEVRAEVAPVQDKLQNLPDARQLGALHEQLAGTSKEITELGRSTTTEISDLRATTDQNAQQTAKLSAALKDVDARSTEALMNQAAKVAVIASRQSDFQGSLSTLQNRLSIVERRLAGEGPSSQQIGELNSLISRQKETINSQGRTIQELKKQVADMERKCALRDRPPGMLQ